MNSLHNPLINFRYWVLLSLVSIFGTNTGDLAVRLCKLSGIFPVEGLLALRHAGPLPILVFLFVLLLQAEKRDHEPSEHYFWSAILLIRTGATNVADVLADDLHVDPLLCSGCLTLLLIILAMGWQNTRTKPINPLFVPNTNFLYWLMMALAGVLGTIVGDYLADQYGLAKMATCLSLAMVILVIVGFKNVLIFTPLYWFGVSLARVAGTDVGDWLAKSSEKGGSGLDLATATVISGFAFTLTALYWKNHLREKPMDQLL